MNGKKFIKFAHRQNLKYPLQLLLWNVLRDVEGSLLSYFLNISDLLLNLPLMFLGELFAGLLIYLYQKQFFLINKTEEPQRFQNIKLIQKEKIIDKGKEKDKKIFFIIFCSAFLDFLEFKLFYVFSKFLYISYSIEMRLKGCYTIYNALFYYFALRLPMQRHQIFSLIFIGICIVIVITTEFIFQKVNIFLTYGQFVLMLFFIFLIHFYSASVESNGKYLYEFKTLNPFFNLMFEGLFGFLISIIYCSIYNPFSEIIKFRKNHSTSDFVFLILSLILYIILSGLKNSYRVLTTKVFSPMTTTFMEYIINPFYLLYYFYTGTDFIPYGDRNYTYFVINLIVSIILTFFGLVYNEFLILFFCGLEKETHNQITKRSLDERELNNIIEQDDDSEI